MVRACGGNLARALARPARIVVATLFSRSLFARPLLVPAKRRDGLVADVARDATSRQRFVPLLHTGGSQFRARALYAD